MKELKDERYFSITLKCTKDLERLTDQGAEQILIAKLKEAAEAEGFTHYTVGVMSKFSGGSESLNLNFYGGWILSIMAYREEVI